MKYRFLIHSLNHTYLVVSITKVGIPDFIIDAAGHEESMDSIRFQCWSDAEAYFSKLGIQPNALLRVIESLRKTSLAVLTIP